MTGTTDVESGVEAVFSKERKSLGDLFRKVFGKEPQHRDIQIGDPIFDDVVLIRTSTEETTRRFLSSELVQNAILELTQQGGTVTINSGAIDVTVRKLGSSGAGTAWREERFSNGSVLFAHFARFARDERANSLDYRGHQIGKERRS